MKINEARSKHTGFFQFMVTDFITRNEVPINEKNNKGEEIVKFNSSRSPAYPFYKPISKIFKSE